MKKVLSGLVLTGLLATGALAQELEHRPAQVSVVPGVSTNGNSSGSFYHTFSFNLLGGYTGGVRGVEYGGILNVNRHFAKGLQMAGVANLVGGETAGLQLAGVLNANTGRAEAVQMAGVTNISKGGSGTAQWAGVANVAGASSTGAQLAGAANVVTGDMQGLQATGVVNVVNGELKGTQLGGVVNRARSFSGAQVGVLNIAGNARGTQIGVINIADSARTTIGLINIVRKNGYYRGEVWAGETFYANAAFKMGTRNFYTLLAAGWKQNDASYFLGYGFGLGSEFLTREKSAYSLDVTGYHLSADELWTDGGVNNLYQARLTWALRLAGNTALLVGGTLNVLHSDSAPAGAEGETDIDIAPWTFYDNVKDGRRVALWPGVNVGFRF